MTSKIFEHDLLFLIHIGNITDQKKIAKQLKTTYNELNEMRKGMIWGLGKKNSNFKEYTLKLIENPHLNIDMYPICWCPCYKNVMVSCPYCISMFQEYKKLDLKANQLATEIYYNSK